MNELRCRPKRFSPDRLNHWSTLSYEEKRAEFLELTASPYWPLLPTEIQSRIHDLLNA
ncbi:hypothetical protein DBW_3164 [Desulfuromonas sp. DDH964]|uniref:hypothetical protein n=1 Tax=Desulfuromonas sp. DDH964 TaxID=1823759 RepID=UPI00078E400E|nr:hypothetical protein [Desulfuromonas sp. DDH964]AMV73471.1 hypothetical protein DBW_3164 [Desulfuromonas sp. DDH964]